MSVVTATFVANMDIDYPYDNVAHTSTASLSYLAMQEVKRPVKTTFPNVTSECSASPAEFHSLLGMGGQLATTLLDTLSADITLQKVGADSTATAAVEWSGSAKFVQSDTPAVALEGDLWFQI